MYFSNMDISLVFTIVIVISTLVGGKLPLRIIGGRDALPNELTFVVRMEIQMVKQSDDIKVARNEHLCSAAVITPTRTLTAAHCIKTLESHLKRIRADVLKIDQQSSTMEIIGVIRYGSVHDKPWTENTISRIIDSVVHPAFKDNSFDFFIHNDIGISRTEPIILASYAKVSAVDFASLLGQEVTVVGYGLTNASSGQPEDTMQLRKPLQILNAMVNRCEARPSVYPGGCLARACGQSSTTCPGDSGGPVLHTSGILGVNTAGSHTDCYVKIDADRSFSVGIVTTINPFIDWIRDQVRDQ